MNRKDYDLLAKWLHIHRPNGTEEDCEYWYSMVRDLCDILRSTNPKFDEVQFLGDCGYTL